MLGAAGSGAWFQNTEFRSCAPCAQLAHSMCSCHHAPSPRSHQTNVTSGSIRTRAGHGNGFPVLLQPSSLFSAAKAAGFPGGFHRARSAAGWLNREDTGAGNPAAEQRIYICFGRTGGRFFCPESLDRGAPPVPAFSFHKKREPLFRMTLTVIRRRPTLPGRFQPSTISVLRLNFCVRDGNRWIPQAIVTGNLFEVRRSRSLPLGCSRTLKTAQVRVIPPA